MEKTVEKHEPILDDETMVSVNMTWYEHQDLIDFIRWLVDVIDRCVLKNIDEYYLDLCLGNARNGAKRFVSLLTERKRSITWGTQAPQEDKRD